MSQESQIIYNTLIDILPTDIINIIVEFRIFNNLQEYSNEIYLLLERTRKEILRNSNEITMRFLDNLTPPTEVEKSTEEGIIRYIKTTLTSFYGKYNIHVVHDYNHVFIDIIGVKHFEITFLTLQKIIQHIAGLNLPHIKGISYNGNSNSDSETIIINL